VRRWRLEFSSGQRKWDRQYTARPIASERNVHHQSSDALGLVDAALAAIRVAFDAIARGDADGAERQLDHVTTTVRGQRRQLFVPDVGWLADVYAFGPGISWNRHVHGVDLRRGAVVFDAVESNG
jgi:hypothetical protein